MRFLLVASILLLVPATFADVGPTVETKLIYVNTTVITDQAACSECYLNYYNHIFDSAVDVYFGPGYNLSVEDSHFEKVKDANYNFVVEKLKLPSDAQEHDCFESSSPSLRPLITSCKGSVRAREVAPRERAQAQQYKYNFMESSRDFKVISHNGRFVTKSNDRVQLILNATKSELTVEVLHGDKSKVTNSKASLSGYLGKSFVVEGTEDTDCYPTPVKGLDVLSCKGRILIRDWTEKDG